VKVHVVSRWLARVHDDPAEKVAIVGVYRSLGRAQAHDAAIRATGVASGFRDFGVVETFELDESEDAPAPAEPPPAP
jgi:hypothetical protein